LRVGVEGGADCVGVGADGPGCGDSFALEAVGASGFAALFLTSWDIGSIS
jgi:hypothetical protein